MLDVSPHMLVYNYGTKTFPLKNMQEIVIYMLRKLSEKYQANKGYQYNVSIYLFSIYQKPLEVRKSFNSDDRSKRNNQRVQHRYSL